QPLKRLLRNDRGNLSADTTSQRRFVQHQSTAGFPDASQNRFLIERGERAQVNDFDIQPFFLQLFGRIKRRQNHGAESEDRNVATLARRARLSNFDNVIILGKFLAQTGQAIKLLVLEVEHRIGIANGGLDQSFRIVGGRWLYNFQTGSVKKETLGIERVKRP